MVDPGNQEALITLLLAMTDQFDKDFTEALESAKEVVPQLNGQYDREYYAGIINERWAKTQLRRGMPGHFVHSWILEAMNHYEKAESLSAVDDPDAVLRWNACARMLRRNETAKSVSESVHHDVEASFGDDVPLR